MLEEARVSYDKNVMQVTQSHEAKVGVFIVELWQ
jgi:hypothetical protein